MPATPALQVPRLGDPITEGGEWSFVKRASSERQAQLWNAVLVDDPVFGPMSGLAVGVAPLRDRDGRYPLVWVHAPTAPPDDNS